MSLLKRAAKTKRRTELKGYAKELFQFVVETSMDYKASGIPFHQTIQKTAKFLRRSVHMARHKFASRAAIRSELDVMFVKILEAVAPLFEEVLETANNYNSQDEGFFEAEILTLVKEYRTVAYGSIEAAEARIRKLAEFMDDYVSIVKDFQGDEEFEDSASLFSLNLLKATVGAIHEEARPLMALLQRPETTGRRILATGTAKKPTKALAPISENAEIDDLLEAFSKKTTLR